jgi:uncharacterized protein YndB with AHSA1/START domain
VVSTTFASATRIGAPPEIVWAVMTDHVRYAKWGSAKTVTIEHPGIPAPNGLGAIRCFHAGPMKVREEVTAWEPHTRMAYRLNTKMLTKDYTSDMRLREDDGATVLEWSSTFVPMVPGTSALVRRIYERAVAAFAAGIKAEAETAAERPA